MPRVSLTFLGGLDELLPRGRRNPLVVAAPEGATAGAIIEDLGIPHTEIGSLRVNERSRTLAWRPDDGDDLAVHPHDPASRQDAAPPRFILDVHLGRLTRLLRLLGFDSEWSRDAGDAELAERAGREDRILLSRDRGLLKRREVHRGCLVRSQDPRLQLHEVAERYGLRGHLAPFTRCLVCNAALIRTVRPAVGPHGGSSGGCPTCGRRYWRGSHWKALNAIVEEVRTGYAARSAPAVPGPPASRLPSSRR